eukprot:6457807-Amphidinium_carterae.1
MGAETSAIAGASCCGNVGALSIHSRGVRQGRTSRAPSIQSARLPIIEASKPRVGCAELQKRTSPTSRQVERVRSDVDAWSLLAHLRMKQCGGCSVLLLLVLVV